MKSMRKKLKTVAEMKGHPYVTCSIGFNDPLVHHRPFNSNDCSIHQTINRSAYLSIDLLIDPPSDPLIHSSIHSPINSFINTPIGRVDFVNFQILKMTSTKKL